MANVWAFWYRCTPCGRSYLVPTAQGPGRRPRRKVSMTTTTKAQIQARVDKYAARMQAIDRKIAALQTKRNQVQHGLTTLQADLAQARE